MTKAVEANGEVSLKVEHSKSAAAKCRVCKEHLQKGAVRINAEHEGFYHPECFKEAKGFEGKPESLEGFEELDDNEKRELEQSFSESPAKKAALKSDEHLMGEADESEEKPLAEAPEEKKHSPPEGDLEAEKAAEEQDVMPPPAVKKIKLDETSEDALKKQTEVLAEVRRLCFTNMLESQMVILLKANNAYAENATIEEALEMLIDGAVFGVPLPCPECNGIVAFRQAHNAYECLECGAFETKEPPRKDMVIPVGMADNDFIASYAIPKLPKRIIEEKSKAVVKDDA
ncbi:poly ADP-ribose metabolism enzyme-1 [Aphelenchoides avenae]|nr:poly ADP-ribose metabolism enzyme-1 [Aphelenchus avenae]